MSEPVKIMSDTPRFGVVTRESLSPEGRRIWDKRVRSVNAPTGHFNVMMQVPALHERIHDLEQFFRTESSITEQEREFMTLVVARQANARFAWGRHEHRAVERGVPREAVEKVRTQAPLESFSDPHRLLVEFARALAGAREPLPEELFQRVKTQKGERWTIEAVALIGHYTMVAVLVHGYGVQPRPSDEPTF
jgi:alkylhydroperoxidase family enzyme